MTETLTIAGMHASTSGIETIWAVIGFILMGWDIASDLWKWRR